MALRFISAIISSRPGQSGRADGYILEGKELEFYVKKIKVSVLSFDVCTTRFLTFLMFLLGPQVKQFTSCRCMLFFVSQCIKKQLLGVELNQDGYVCLEKELTVITARVSYCFLIRVSVWA